MPSVLSIAVSGLQAATKRVAVSANNVANASTSRPAASPQGVFRAQDVVLRSVGNGGVQADVTERSPSTVTAPGLSGGTDLFPNVNLAEEAVEQEAALASYRANAAVIRVQQELDDALLDIET